MQSCSNGLEEELLAFVLLLLGSNLGMIAIFIIFWVYKLKFSQCSQILDSRIRVYSKRLRKFLKFSHFMTSNSLERLFINKYRRVTSIDPLPAANKSKLKLMSNKIEFRSFFNHDVIILTSSNKSINSKSDKMLMIIEDDKF